MDKISVLAVLAVMNYQQGKPREQMSMMSLEADIAPDNPVRLVDLFVDQLDLSKLGFKKTSFKQEGRPCYQAADLLKLYYYGYLNRVRSSRKLEAECRRNIEVWWLLHELKPGYHTIADFRKDNAAALKQAFKMFVSFLKGEDMFSKELIVVDGTKVRAQNSNKNNFNEARLKKHLAYIESKAETYIKELNDCDVAEDRQASELKKKEVQQKLDTLKQRKQKYEQLKKELNESEANQISTTDPESRSLKIKDNIAEIAYNIQAATDSKHSLIAEFDTINENDQNQLSNMSSKAMQVLEVEQITVLTDKGYHVGKQLELCREQGVTTIVSYIDRNSRSKHIDPAYQTDQFIYDPISDIYTCPEGAVLTTNGKYYEKVRKSKTTYLIKQYSTRQCKNCPAKYLCTRSSKGYRQIERSQYQEVIDENNKRVDANVELCKKRQQIVEHPFGTIKRGWGYTYTLLRGIRKVNGEMALIFTMYNLRRAITILGVFELLKRLKKWKNIFRRYSQAICKTERVQLYLRTYELWSIRRIGERYN
jgi:radical SAM protein with 4Fe4S-binding SPASM domain